MDIFAWVHYTTKLLLLNMLVSVLPRVERSAVNRVVKRARAAIRACTRTYA